MPSAVCFPGEDDDDDELTHRLAMPALRTAVEIALTAVQMALRSWVSSPVLRAFLPSSITNRVRVTTLVSKVDRSVMVTPREEPRCCLLEEATGLPGCCELSAAMAAALMLPVGSTIGKVRGRLSVGMEGGEGRGLPIANTERRAGNSRAPFQATRRRNWAGRRATSRSDETMHLRNRRHHEESQAGRRGSQARALIGWKGKSSWKERRGSLGAAQSEYEKGSGERGGETGAVGRRSRARRVV